MGFQVPARPKSNDLPICHFSVAYGSTRRLFKVGIDRHPTSAIIVFELSNTHFWKLALPRTFANGPVGRCGYQWTALSPKRFPPEDFADQSLLHLDVVCPALILPCQLDRADWNAVGTLQQAEQPVCRWIHRRSPDESFGGVSGIARSQ